MAFNLSSVMGMFRPTIKSEDVIINNLKAAKTTEAGSMSDTMQKVLSGGLSKMLQNPSGSSGGKAKQNSQNASQQASTKNEPGYSALNNPVSLAFNGLSSDIDALIAQAANLVGLGSDNTTFLQAIGWTEIGNNLGPDSPYSAAVILKPANSEDELLDAASQVLAISNDYIIGMIDKNTAITRINAIRAVIQGITNGSVNATTAIQNAIVDLTSAIAANGLLQGGSSEWQSVMDRAIKLENRLEIDLGNQNLLSTG